MDARDIKQVKFFAKALRVTKGNVGSSDLWNIGIKIEYAAVQEDYDLVVSCYYELKPVFEKLVRFFKQSLSWLERAKSIKTATS